MDLEKYFDTINQSKLIQILLETVKDGRVISLIHKFLRAGIMVEGLFEESPEGVPQGGPLSPLLGNIMLNEWTLRSFFIYTCEFINNFLRSLGNFSVA